jgi:uncharacterized metal-binding protein YceD (DUF177 family)
MQRVHEDGECNPDAVRYLSAGEPVASDTDENNPFASLKELFK